MGIKSPLRWNLHHDSCGKPQRTDARRRHCFKRWSFSSSTRNQRSWSETRLFTKSMVNQPINLLSLKRQHCSIPWVKRRALEPALIVMAACLIACMSIVAFEGKCDKTRRSCRISFYTGRVTWQLSLVLAGSCERGSVKRQGHEKYVMIFVRRIVIHCS
jgi:hypothetical protein